MLFKFKEMKINIVLFFCLVFIIGIFSSGCAPIYDNKDTALLTTDGFIDVALSAPEGSGGLRTLTINFTIHGEKKSDTMNNVSSVDIEGFDDEKKEQSFTVSDYNQDGIIDLIVYREFWFPNLEMMHLEVPKWPAVYEYDLEKGFVIASSKYKDFFEEYVESSTEKLSLGKEQMSEIEMLALKRLIFAADKVAEGSFTPKSPYNDEYYADVYELVKITE